MQAYRFETRISKEGIIQLPLNQQLFGKEVDIIIFTKEVLKSTKNASALFVDKWAGFLSDDNTDDAKYQNLKNNYL
ncbi:MAG: hypothetical protein WCH34_12345 [Bacteroidota bacterium]